MRHPPIALMSFNRPHYFEQVVRSLIAQEGTNISEREIFLFQDGAVNAYSGRRYADDEAIAECIKIFRDSFPHGVVHYSEQNIGVAENFLRAEKFFFENRGDECAYFFEDDLVLTPRYLSILDDIARQCNKIEKIGYFACYGMLHAEEDDQRTNISSITRIRHLWGFGIFRRHWLDMQPHLKAFYDYVLGKDYRQRPTKEILEHYQSKGILAGASSQDDIKYATTHYLNRVGINTYLANATYIGEVGLHFRPETYEKLGFHKTKIIEAPEFKFVAPGTDVLASLHAEFDRTRRKRLADAKQAGSSAPPVKALPKPRMSPAELQRFEALLRSSKGNYAEFGTGGSTLLAVRSTFENIVSVESDPAWARRVRSDPDVAAAISAGRASILHADIGPVADWGNPADRSAIERWPTYVARMWEEWDRRGAFPDLVLVDGRFRVACCISVALAHAARGGGDSPVVLLHDFSEERPAYKRVFDFFELVEQVESLCILTPRTDVTAAAMLSGLLRRIFDRG